MSKSLFAEANRSTIAEILKYLHILLTTTASPTSRNVAVPHQHDLWIVEAGELFESDSGDTNGKNSQVSPIPARRIRDERHLRSTHWRSMSSPERDALAKALTKEFKAKSGDTYSSAVLVALAICASLPLKRAIALKASKASDAKRTETAFVRSQHSAPIPGSRRLKIWFTYTLWQVTPNRTVVLPIPGLLIELFCAEDAALPHEPIEVFAWLRLAIPEKFEEKTLAWVESVLMPIRRNQDRAYQLLSFTPTAVYSRSTSRATVEYVATLHPERGALNETQTYYITPKHPAIASAFGDALAPYLHQTTKTSMDAAQLGARGDSSPSLRGYKSHIKLLLAQLEHLATPLKHADMSRANQNLPGGDLLRKVAEFHNMYVAYVSMLLLISTGHRRSLTLFSFEFDIQEDLGLAFVADKQIGGNAARWVPLNPVIADQVREYKKHRSILLGWLPRPAGNALSTAPFLFRVDAKGKIKTLTTLGVEAILHSYLGDGFVAINARETRRAVASSLFFEQTRERDEAPAAGQTLAAFLGHSASLQPIGITSFWSVSQFANTCRDRLSATLAEINVRPVVSPLKAWCRALPAVTRLPALNMQAVGYEKRAIHKSQARSRAQRAVQNCAESLGLLKWQPSVSEQKIVQLKEAAFAQLANDRHAQDQIKTVIDALLLVLQRRSMTIELQAIRTGYGEASPVVVGDSRRLAIATYIRSALLRHIDRSLSSRMSIRDAAVLLLIGLVVFDAMLDPEQLASAIGAINDRDYYSVGSRTALRFSQRRHDGTVCDRLVYLGAVNAALLTFIDHQRPSNGEAETNNLNVAGSRANGISVPTEATASRHGSSPVYEVSTSTRSPAAPTPPLLTLDKAMLRERFQELYIQWRISEVSRPRTIEELTIVASAWWRLHLPGILMPAATGLHACPAPSLLTESRMHGTRPVATHQEGLRASPASVPPVSVNNEKNEASRWLDDLLSRASGNFTVGDTSSRTQRMRLTKLLKSAELSQTQPGSISVAILREFLLSLVENGGIQKRRLKFNTIRTYFSDVKNAILACAWNEDLTEFESGQFDELYGRIRATRSEKELGDINTSIALFHRFLESEHGADPCLSAYVSNERTTAPRGGLLTNDDLEEAEKILENRTDLDVTQRKQAILLLHLLGGFGLRVTEALGLHAHDLIECNTGGRFAVDCHKNALRSLKSTSARRLIPIAFCTSNGERAIAAARKDALLSSQGSQTIFQDPTAQAGRSPQAPMRQAVANALKQATGESEIVLHSLRHTYCSALLSHTIPVSDRADPWVRKTLGRLPGKARAADMFLEIAGGVTNYPFWGDRIAELLGHSDTVTMANVYWHTSALHLAEYARSALLTELPGQNFFALALGYKGASAIAQAKRRAKPVRDSTADGVGTHAPAPDTYDLMCQLAAQRLICPSLNELVRELGTESANKLPLEISRSRRSKIRPAIPSTSENWGLTVDALDRILTHRCASGSDLIFGLAAHAEELSLNPMSAVKLTEQYRELVERSGETCFEPQTSNIATILRGENSGCGRFARGRQEALARLQNAVNADAIAATKVDAAAESWLLSVSRADEQWCMVNIDEAASAGALIRMVGLKEDQIAIAITSATASSQLLRAFSEGFHGDERSLFPYKVDDTFTPHAKKVRKPALALSCSSTAPAWLRHRGMHRMMFVLALTVNMKRTEPALNELVN